VKDPKN